MRYLVIGGTSVFGEGLIDRLLSKENTELVVATRLPDEGYFHRDRLTWQVLDLRDEELTGAVLQSAHADVLFHLAAQDSVGYSWKYPTETVDINVVGTINLLNAVRDFSPKTRVVIGGSGEEYGRIGFDGLPVKETAIPHPVNIFGATKACQTMFARLYHQAFNLDVIVLRTFYETSVQQNEQFAVSSFCKQFAEMEAGKREPVIYTGNLNNIRDFTDVDDLIRAFELAAEKGKSGEVYNAARGQAMTLLQVVEILEGLTGIEVRICSDSSRMRPMDSPAVFADSDKLLLDCGWRAEVPIEQTIEKLLNHWRKRI